MSNELIKDSVKGSTEARPRVSE